MRYCVLKYPFQDSKTGGLDFHVDVPRDAIALDVQEQRGTLMLWALVDADQAERRRRTYSVRMTGEYIEPPATRLGNHVKTIQRPDGLVVHVFETT